MSAVCLLPSAVALLQVWSAARARGPGAAGAADQCTAPAAAGGVAGTQDECVGVGERHHTCVKRVGGHSVRCSSTAVWLVLQYQEIVVRDKLCP